MNKYAVIVAGGKGVRMNSALPKQFLPLCDKPILYHTIKAFIDAFADVKIILVLPEDNISYTQMVLQAFTDRIDLTIITGGATRFHSVQNGLQAIDGDGVVFVHDGVRPLLSTSLIHACYDQAVEKGSAIPAIAVSDSMRIVDGEDSRPVDRNKMRSIQTPQTFRTDIILSAFEQEYSDKFTDEATVVESAGYKVTLIEGEKSNIKITTPEDMKVAESILAERGAHV